MSALLKPKVLVTGPPGIGKTTLMTRIVSALTIPVFGFFTREIRQAGNRVGFAIETFSEPHRQGILSHIDTMSRHKVGRYGVDLTTFEKIALPELESGLRANSLIVMDEIGKMELLSDKFKILAEKIIDSDTALLATVLLKPNPFVDRLKRRGNIELIKLTAANRDNLVEKIKAKLIMAH
jgi:nucleoside-triphosphatase